VLILDYSTFNNYNLKHLVSHLKAKSVGGKSNLKIKK